MGKGSQYSTLGISKPMKSYGTSGKSVESIPEAVPVNLPRSRAGELIVYSLFATVLAVFMLIFISQLRKTSDS
jgi:hypothetical protein